MMLSVCSSADCGDALASTCKNVTVRGDAFGCGWAPIEIEISDAAAAAALPSLPAGQGDGTMNTTTIAFNITASTLDAGSVRLEIVTPVDQSAATTGGPVVNGSDVCAATVATGIEALAADPLPFNGTCTPVNSTGTLFDRSINSYALFGPATGVILPFNASRVTGPVPASDDLACWTGVAGVSTAQSDGRIVNARFCITTGLRCTNGHIPGCAGKAGINSKKIVGPVYMGVTPITYARMAGPDAHMYPGLRACTSADYCNEPDGSILSNGAGGKFGYSKTGRSPAFTMPSPSSVGMVGISSYLRSLVSALFVHPDAGGLFGVSVSLALGFIIAFLR